MLDERMNMPDDQIYKELISVALSSDTQLDDVTVKDLAFLLEKFLAANNDLEPSQFIGEWLRYAL